jgi:glycosyltransferase involved in cell wall biosynthesis
MSDPFCILTTSYPSFRPDDAVFPRGKFVHDMARFLARADVPVEVVTHLEQGTTRDSTVDSIRIHRFSAPGVGMLVNGGGLPENVRSPRKRLALPGYFLAMFARALRTLRSMPRAVINAHWAFPTGLVGLGLKAISGRPLLVTVYGAEVYPFQHGHWPWLKPLVGAVIRKADWVAAISPAAAAAASEVSGRNDIRVIPDGIDVDYYSPGPRDERVAAKYLAGKKFLFFTGRMVERKGHRFIVEALGLLRDRLPDLCALIGGDGPLSDDVRQRARSLGVAERIAFPGMIPESDLVPLLRTCALYVLPSCVDAKGDTEGSATAALEAMACGAVALVADVGGNRGAVESGRGAYYFRAGDAKDLADTIATALGRSDLDQQRRAGRDYVVARYAWQRSIADYLQLIAEKRP